MDQEQNTHTHTLLSEVSRTTAVLLASGSRVNGGVCSTLVCKLHVCKWNRRRGGSLSPFAPALWIVHYFKKKSFAKFWRSQKQHKFFSESGP